MDGLKHVGMDSHQHRPVSFICNSMKNCLRKFAKCVLSILAPVSFFSGCSTPQNRTARESPEHAYIAYWPPPAGGNQLRVAVKDLIDMKGVVTTAGSEYFAKNSPPASRDAKCLAIARERNVQIVGKTNQTELALGVSGINKYFGTPRNRVSEKRKLISGGSSSGSAVAVANGTADVAIGTDTAGSIRVPAACCGIAGLKTTFGLVPLDGVYPIAPKYLDTVGPMARDVARLVQGMDLLQAGFAARYEAARAPAKSIRIGRLYVAGTDPKIDRAVDEALAAKGFKVVVLNRAFKAKWEQAEKDGRTVAVANAWFTNQKLSSEREVTLGTKAVFALGKIEYDLNYRAALKRRAAWQHALRQTFQKVDFIALPTLKALPPSIPFFVRGPVLEALTLSLQNTVAVNLAGNPALAIPIPVRDEAVPVTSLQLIGPRLSEAGLLNAGRIIEARR